MAGAFAFMALFLPWFQPEAGKPVLLFGALDRQTELLSPTAWQAFAWEDVAIAALAAATTAVALAGRRWFLVPVAGALFTAAVLIAHRSRNLFASLGEGEATFAGAFPLPATASGYVPLLAFAVAAAALAAGRYRFWRR